MRVIRPLFDKYQKYLLAFANTSFGREYLSLWKWAKIKNNYKIVKVVPDGIHFFTGEYTKKGLSICQAVFFSKSPYLKKFSLALEGLEIASELIGKIRNPEFVIPHFGGLIAPRSWLPLVMRSSLTQYPDAHPETKTVDGEVVKQVKAPWPSIRTGVGTSANDTDNTFSYLMNGHADDPNFEHIARGIAGFYIDLPTGSVLDSGTLSFRGESKVDNGGFSPNSCVYNATPASNTALVANDFDQTGTTQFSDTVKTYGQFSTTGYNDYPLNTAGIDDLVIGEVANFGFKNKTYDADSGLPTWHADDSELSVYAADFGSNKPKLVIAYTAPAPGFYLH